MRTCNHILTSGSVSSSFSTSPFRVENMDRVSVQLVQSGTALTGTYTLYASNDFGKAHLTDPTNATGIFTWTAVSDSSQALTGSGDVMWNVADIGWRWLKVGFSKTATAATGTVVITVNAKG